VNYSKAIFLVNDDVRAVACVYEPEEYGNKAKRYTFKTMDQTLAVDDLVVVPTGSREQRLGYTVVQIKEVDIQVDVEDDIELKWIVSRVDKENYDAVLGAESTLITMAQSAQQMKKRKELREAFMEGVDEGTIKGLGPLRISDQNGKKAES